jgi:purine nucleosidase
MAPKRIIIDTDGEFDDVLALALALSSPEIKVEAITTISGVRCLEDSTGDVLNTLELMGHTEIPVAMGFRQHFSKDMTSNWERVRKIWATGGRSSTSPLRKPDIRAVDVDAVELLISKVMQEPGEFTLVTLGALTNVAAAILREPRFSSCLRESYTMGGAVLVQGNMNPVAEFNIWSDPEAAKIYFNSGLNITLVGLEVYYKARLRQDQWNNVAQSSEAMQYIFENFDPWIKYLDRHDPSKAGALEIGDALTIGAIVEPDLFTKQRCFIDVETKGELTSGMTVGYGLSARSPAPKTMNTDLCVDMNANEFNKLFLERVKKGF